MHVASIALALISAGAALGFCFLPIPFLLMSYWDWGVLFPIEGLAIGLLAVVSLKDRFLPETRIATPFHIGQLLFGGGCIVLLFPTMDRQAGAHLGLGLAMGFGAGLMFAGAPHILRYAGYVPFFSGAGTLRAFLPYGLAVAAATVIGIWLWVLTGHDVRPLFAGFGLLQWGLAWRLTRRGRRAGTDERHE